MNIYITRYGLSKKAKPKPGWDGIGDSGTDSWTGNHDNKLIDGISCALTVSAQAQLKASEGRCEPGDWLQLTYSNGYVEVRRFDDRAPQDHPRVDRFMAFIEDKNQPSEYAEVKVLGRYLL